MKRKQIKIEFLLPVALVLMGAGAAGLLVRPAEEPDLDLKARFGTVTWNHELHARMKGLTCQTCHHQERPGATELRPCGECHAIPDNRQALILGDLFEPADPGPAPSGEAGPSGEAAPSAMKAFHAKCLGCHQAMKQGPVGCRDCHAQSFVGNHGQVTWNHRMHARQMDELTCTDCHHQDQGRSEAEVRPCGLCHQPLATMNVSVETGVAEHETARHGQCYTCHTVDNPEVGTRLCTECHQGMRPEKGAPSLEDAVHARCLECHHPDYPESDPGMPRECSDCHRPSASLLEGGTAGPVLWSHRRHAEFGEGSCEECHHTDLPGEPHLACYRCHGRTDLGLKLPKLAEAAHDQCIGCHEDRGDGPVECDGCHSQDRMLNLMRFEGKNGTVWWDHRFHADAAGLSCRECHHNTMRQGGLFFTVCDSAVSCPEGAGNPAPCETCHAREGEAAPVPAGGKPAPDLGEAVNQSCLECHRRMGAGPTECKDCHLE